jgi:hypothetical protein
LIAGLKAPPSEELSRVTKGHYIAVASRREIRLDA